ncbi:MAG: OmpA family protein [Bacteroidota bacterium]
MRVINKKATALFYTASIAGILFLFGCKDNPQNKTIEESSSENSYERSAQIDSVDLDQGMEEAGKALGEAMSGLGNLLIGGNAKDSLGNSLFDENGQINLEFLKSEQGAQARETFGAMAGISEKEVALALTAMSDFNIVSVKHAVEIENSLANPQIEEYIASGEASQNFVDLLEENRLEARERTADFKQRAQRMKEAFYRDNPSWFALTESIEDVYIDYRLEMVYLPMGDISFADSLVAFNPGEEAGNTPMEALGPAQGQDPRKVEYINLGLDGSIVFFFEDNAITDINGDDIYVFELGEIEPARLSISKDGQNWIDVGQIEGGTAGLDISPYVKPGETFNYLKLKDLKTYSGIPGADIDAVAAIGGALRMNLNSAVLFETGKADLKPEGLEAIKELSEQLVSIPKGTIKVEGHTDDVGSDASNRILSEKRAASVASALQSALKNPSFKWKIVGHGESQPIVANDTDENRQKNRRVEILVVPF